MKWGGPIGILRCPATRQALRPAEAALLHELNERIRRGELWQESGERVDEPLEEALVTADLSLVYPIRGAVPVLIRGEGIPVAGSGPARSQR